MTLLPLVDPCDNFSFENCTEDIVPFCLSPDADSPVGWILPQVLEELKRYNDDFAQNERPFYISQTRIAFAPHINDFDSRSLAAKNVCEKWRDSGVFADVIGGRLWRDELYCIYANPFRGISKDSAAFVMERVCCALFGLVTYGVHMTMYTTDGRIWVPRRSKTKQTWPGYLDNSVAGGIPHGLTPFESLVKECMEEASLTEDVARQAKCVGSITYFLRTPKGFFQPEAEYVYDLCVPPPGEGLDLEKYIPKPLDGEVESFVLMTVDEVISRMKAGEFKANTAVVIIDWLFRHGHITPENEPNFLEIKTRINGRYGYDAYVARMRQK